MDSLRKVYHNSQGPDFKRRVRELKNTVYNYSEMEQLVREATCNDAREPAVMLMKEIAKGTFTVDFAAIMTSQEGQLAAKFNVQCAFTIKERVVWAGERFTAPVCAA